MTATIAEERYTAERNSEEGIWAIFRGRNLIRFFIAGWPKIVQQFVGLSVFNTYATYFCTFLLLLLSPGSLPHLSFLDICMCSSLSQFPNSNSYGKDR
ncbi:MAG: hypothetical protein CL912_10035 [Deltaproteobacteria bacterium]|nr:hypothetical protein [Deltaproteobacteria bacterium]|tara:strand:- start:86 stop:379 length:294 start_codon:yes stop_codon:yes gene_type:complete